METTRAIETDVRGLIDEVKRYLVAVDVFRAEGCEPHYAAEHDTPPARAPRPRGVTLTAPPIA
jgi:hypothetical protein